MPISLPFFSHRKKAVKSLTNILSSFNTVIQELRDLEAHNEGKVNSNNEVVKRIQEENSVLTAEKEQAQKVRDRIAGLIEK